MGEVRPYELRQKIRELHENNIELARKGDTLTSVINGITKYFDGLERHELFVVKLKYGEGLDIKAAHEWYEENIGSCPDGMGRDHCIFLFTDKEKAALFKLLFY